MNGLVTKKMTLCFPPFTAKDKLITVPHSKNDLPLDGEALGLAFHQGEGQFLHFLKISYRVTPVLKMEISRNPASSLFTRVPLATSMM